jgi:hypothetical protein
MMLHRAEPVASTSRTRIWTIVSLLIIVPVGFYAKFYTGPAANWVNNSLSGLFYVIFWCLLIFLMVAHKPGVIALAVLLVTCTLEFAQLWHLPVLEFARSNFFGRTLLGTYFTWSDFPYYFLGCGIGWLWMRFLHTSADKLTR